MKDVSAKGIRTTVVAIKVSGKFILRGIKKWANPEVVRERMEPYVAIMTCLLNTDEYEWTFHNYFSPHYLEYGDGDLPQRASYSDGLYLFPIHCDQPGCDEYGPAKKIEAW
jgi:hypothetical protein